MSQQDPRIDAYIAKSAEFAQPILSYIREQIHKNCPGAQETVKWSMPHFEYQGEIFCAFAGFKQHCSLRFWRGALLGLKESESEGMGQFGKLTSIDDLPPKRQFAKLIKDAAKLHEQGVKLPAKPKPVKKQAAELDIPVEFLSAMKKNKAALATFEGFPPSKKKDYVTWYTEAKTDVTREKRLLQSIEWMAEGKARNWKYEKC